MVILKKIINYRVILFTVVFGYLTIWIWQGIDLTDSGMHLTKQWMVFNGGVENQLDIVFGVSFIGGLWNSIIGGNYLIWVYFGSVLINSLSVLFVYLILSNFFNWRITFIAVLSVTPLLVVPTIKVLNYNDIPLFLFLLVAYFINRSLLSGSLKISNLFMIVSGVVYSIAIISRLTLVIFLLFPIILIIYNLYFRDLRIRWFKKSLFFVVGLFLGLLVIFLVLYKYGLLKIYLENIYSTVFRGLLGGTAEEAPITFTHSLSGTIFSTLNYYYYSLILLPVILVFLNISSYLKKISNRIVQYILFALYCLLLIWFIFRYLGVYGYYSYVYYIIFCLNIFIILTYLSKSKDKKINFILLLILYSQMIINFGSIVMNWTNMFLSTSLSIILLFNLSKIKFSDRFMSFIRFVNLKVVLIVILVILGVTTNYFNIYRDSPNRLELNNSFKTDNLKYVFTTEERSSAIDEVIEEICSDVEPLDEILCTNNIPMLYYLTETKPATKEPWALNFYTLDTFEEELTEIFNERPPKIVVIAKGSTRRDIEWPKNVEEVGVHSRNVDKLLFVYEVIDNYDYKLDWENAGFELYKKEIAE